MCSTPPSYLSGLVLPPKAYYSPRYHSAYATSYLALSTAPSLSHEARSDELERENQLRAPHHQYFLSSEVEALQAVREYNHVLSRSSLSMIADAASRLSHLPTSVEAAQAYALRAAAAREYALKSQPSVQEATRKETSRAAAKPQKRRGRPRKNRPEPSPEEKIENEDTLRAEYQALPPSVAAVIRGIAYNRRGAYKRKSDHTPAVTSIHKKVRTTSVSEAPVTTASKIGRQPSPKEMKENELRAELYSLPPSLQAEVFAEATKNRGPVPNTVPSKKTTAPTVPTTTVIILPQSSPPKGKMMRNHQEELMRAEFQTLPPTMAVFPVTSKKRRGRPPSIHKNDPTAADPAVCAVTSKRKRGRPRKNVVPTVATPPVPNTPTPTRKIIRRQLSPKEMKENKLRAEFYSLPPSLQALVFAEASRNRAQKK